MMAALPTVLDELFEQAAFRIYVTDALYAMGVNAKMKRRYADIINKRNKKDNRTGEEIANDLFQRMGLTDGTV